MAQTLTLKNDYGSILIGTLGDHQTYIEDRSLVGVGASYGSYEFFITGGQIVSLPTMNEVITGWTITKITEVDQPFEPVGKSGYLSETMAAIQAIGIDPKTVGTDDLDINGYNQFAYNGQGKRILNSDGEPQVARRKWRNQRDALSVLEPYLRETHATSTS